MSDQKRQPDDHEMRGSARKAAPPASPSTGALSQNAVSCAQAHAHSYHQLPPPPPPPQVGLLQAAVFESGRARQAAPTPREMKQQLTGACSATVVRMHHALCVELTP